MIFNGVPLGNSGDLTELFPIFLFLAFHSAFIAYKNKNKQKKNVSLLFHRPRMFCLYLRPLSLRSGIQPLFLSHPNSEKQDFNLLSPHFTWIFIILSTQQPSRGRSPTTEHKPSFVPPYFTWISSSTTFPG